MRRLVSKSRRRTRDKQLEDEEMGPGTSEGAKTRVGGATMGVKRRDITVTGRVEIGDGADPGPAHDDLDAGIPVTARGEGKVRGEMIGSEIERSIGATEEIEKIGNEAEMRGGTRIGEIETEMRGGSETRDEEETRERRGAEERREETTSDEIVETETKEGVVETRGGVGARKKGTMEERKEGRKR